MFVNGTPERVQSRRVMSASVDISQEKIATGSRLPPAGFERSAEGRGLPLQSTSSAIDVQMFIASDVLPIDGRAARTIISELRSPWITLSRSLNPVERPFIPDVSEKRRSIFANVASSDSLNVGCFVSSSSEMAKIASCVSLRIAVVERSGE